MREMTSLEVSNVSGGIWQVIVAVYAALEIADAVYTAGKAGAETYKENRVPQTNLGQL